MIKTLQQREHPPAAPSPADDNEHPAPTRDSSVAAEPLSPIEGRFQGYTYRLADLNVLFVESAAETTGSEILRTEFYFGRPVIRCAVVHRCASEGGRQYAMAWLFEQAEPDPHEHLPAAELTVSADGKVYVSAGCPIDYPFRPQARTAEPRNAPAAAVEATEDVVQRATSSSAARASASRPLRQHARSVWIPLCLLAILAGGVLGYRYLIAPGLTASETAAAPAEGEPLKVVAVEQEDRVDPELSASMPAPSTFEETDAPMASESDSATSDGAPAASDGAPAASEGEAVASEGEPTTSQQRPARSARQPATAKQRPAASRPRLSERKAGASNALRARRPDAARPRPRSSAAAPAVQAPSRRSPTIAASPIAASPIATAAPPAAADPPFAMGGTRGEGPETTQPLIAKEQPPAPTVIARQEPPQPAPAPAVQTQRQQVAVANTWLTRMRSELVACGKPGFWRHDVCREVTRWKYCHPDRWNKVAECGVESFR